MFLGFILFDLYCFVGCRISHLTSKVNLSLSVSLQNFSSLCTRAPLTSDKEVYQALRPCSSTPTFSVFCVVFIYHFDDHLVRVEEQNSAYMEIKSWIFWHFFIGWTITHDFSALLQSLTLFWTDTRSYIPVHLYHFLNLKVSFDTS